MGREQSSGSIHATDDLRALKTAFLLLVKRVGGLLAAEACVRVSASQIARYYDQNDLSTFPPADIVAGLEAIAGVPLVTAELARLAGHRLVGLRAADGEHLAAAVAAFARKAGAVPAALCTGLADGRLSRAELGEIVREASSQSGQLAEIAARALAEILACHSPAAPAVEGEAAPARRSPAGRAGGRRATPGRGGPAA